MKIMNLNLKKLLWYSLVIIVIFVVILWFFSHKGIAVETAKVKYGPFVQYYPGV
ncbi:Uncharacterised protein [Legionella steigerwaltii]|uniref:Uncharacterized protein n=1 Tax=Legionella steigerwaltii TaxID=460 RepID=A0A378LBL7_9GAMM|nr:hypothetical protein Lstg_1509 [Legionella steigerwaltii]STY24425.1 Uncharacterised protein [Legionella steigerwaltii]